LSYALHSFLALPALFVFSYFLDSVCVFCLASHKLVILLPMPLQR
jgi:hypothetical protein